jgi:hypothetical protein
MRPKEKEKEKKEKKKRKEKKEGNGWMDGMDGWKNREEMQEK